MNSKLLLPIFLLTILAFYCTSRQSSSAAASRSTSERTASLSLSYFKKPRAVATVATPPPAAATPVQTIEPTPVVELPPSPLPPRSKPSPTAMAAIQPTPPLSKLYVQPVSKAKEQAALWQNSNPEAAVQMEKIFSQPQAYWFGDWNANLQTEAKSYVTAAEADDSIPVLVAYNISSRDCGNYSAGGADSAKQYRTWIDSLTAGIGDTKAWVILEPDALALTQCLSDTDKNERMSLIKEAVHTLKLGKQTSVYIDAGHPGWIAPSEMAPRLRAAGIEEADGFSLNVSNFMSTSDNISYGETLSRLIGNKHFVIDTSRNGNGPSPDGTWCNPSGRALGNPPSLHTGHPLVDAFLWIKHPGESDGTCNGGPSAGTWWPEYALGLAEATH